MNDPIEIMDRKRRNYLAIYIVSFGVFLAAFIARYILKNTGALTESLDWVIAVPFALSLPFQFYGGWGLNAVRGRIKREPEKYAALYDELVKFQELKAWRFGFIAMAAGLALLCVLTVFFTVPDVPSLLFVCLFAGLGGYHLSFFLMNRG
jgi:hypothetical protein